MKHITKSELKKLFPNTDYFSKDYIDKLLTDYKSNTDDIQLIFKAILSNTYQTKIDALWKVAKNKSIKEFEEWNTKINPVKKKYRVVNEHIEVLE
jgi:hypothetical protein